MTITLSAPIAAARVIDAVDDLSDHFSALEAVEQLMSLQKAGSEEDLAHINRSGLGFLFTVLNVSLRERITAARTAAELACNISKGV